MSYSTKSINMFVIAFAVLLGAIAPAFAQDCSDDADCSSPAPFCNLASTSCVECLVNSHCDDALFCNGQEECRIDGLCQPGTNPCAADGLVCNEGFLPLCIPCTADSECDDGNACTDDSCDLGSGTCDHTDTTEACDDGSACTSDDTCSGGTCSGTAIDCDDSDECTDDGCDPASGCTHDAADCDDGDECTTDTCDPATGCAHDTIDCDDGDECTDDSCDSATGCAHDPTDCDDGDDCTTDSCDSNSGCENTEIDCDDSDPCTDDSCANGACSNVDIEGCESCAAAGECDDQNACTADSCVNGVCEHDNIPGQCDDGNPCTEGDACADGVCAGAPIEGCVTCDVNGDCPAGEVCVAAGQCLPTQVAPCVRDADCDEGESCVNDSCHAGCGADEDCPENQNCVNSFCYGPCASNNDCDDGDFCTGPETCEASVCTAGELPCGLDQTCDDVAETCCDEAGCGGGCGCTASAPFAGLTLLSLLCLRSIGLRPRSRRRKRIS